MTTTLRCTQHLLARMKIPTIANDVEPSTLLGDWYANLVHVGRLQLVLAVSERTFLPVVVPAAPISTLTARLRTGVREVLDSLDIPREELDAEMEAMTPIAVGRTSNRQAIGILVDFAHALDFFVDDEPSLLRVALRLAETPCSPLSKTTVSPDRATVATFARKVRGN